MAGDAVLLLHGAGMTARLWRRQAEALSARYRVIAPDLPGFGGSDDDPAIRIVRDYGRFAARFLAALGLERAFVVGSSMGGWAACWLAADRPEMVRGLVLFAPGGLSLKAAPIMSAEEIIAELRLQYGLSLMPGSPLQLTAAGELDKAVATLERLKKTGAFEADLEGALSEIRAKTLVVWGSEDMVVPPAYARAFGDGIKGSEVKILRGAGHIPFAERPDEVNALLLDFLSGLS